MLEVFPDADLVQVPNAHLPDLTVPSEPLGVDESEGSESEGSE